MTLPPAATPELLSPAAHWPHLHAAIEAGADAVYFGLHHFSARAKVGFTLEELPRVLATLHRRGVRGYVTFNTLVFDHELGRAAEVLAALAQAGADALIVQDLGIARLARRIAPELRLHASTQMSITDAAGVRFAEGLGLRRVVLARELSLEEVRAIRSETACELEVFAHGALCVSYSGQCFSSEAWGGRSANRGQCAQTCRLPYQLQVDGAPLPLGDARYLLSPGDLYTLRHVSALVAAGVSALKIEGRYKDPNYVALTTRAYRRALDAAAAGAPAVPDPQEEARLEQVYSRGLGPWFIAGTDHQAVVKGRLPGHRGMKVGRVVRVAAPRVVIAPEPALAAAPLKAGDGVVFDAADRRSPAEGEEGGRLFRVAADADGLLTLEFGNGAVDFTRIRPGDLLWRTHDPELDKALRPLTEAATPQRRQMVRVRATVHEGAPLRLDWALGSGATVSVTAPEPLGTAQNRGATPESLREQLARLGNTPYQLAELEVDLRGRPFVPTSLLNDLRRRAVELLAERQAQPPRLTVHDPAESLAALLPAVATPAPAAAPPQWHLLVRTPEQLRAALELRPASITLDYLDFYGLRPALEQIRAAGIEARVAGPRLLKPGERRVAQFLRALECPVLVRSSGLLAVLREAGGGPLVGDFSLNVANVLSADALLRLGLERLTPGYDLNAAQVSALVAAIGAPRIEAVVYQHLPIFHTEHCVFCRFLSSGHSYRDCGRPCEQRRVALCDGNGRAHPVMADVGCRNTVFGAQAQEASRHLEAWLGAGVRHLRLEFVHESAAQVTDVVRAFREALAGGGTARALAQRLRRAAPQGTTEGSLFVAPGYPKVPG